MKKSTLIAPVLCTSLAHLARDMAEVLPIISNSIKTKELSNNEKLNLYHHLVSELDQANDTLTKEVQRCRTQQTTL